MTYNFHYGVMTSCCNFTETYRTCLFINYFYYFNVFQNLFYQYLLFQYISFFYVSVGMLLSNFFTIPIFCVWSYTIWYYTHIYHSNKNKIVLTFCSFCNFITNIQCLLILQYTNMNNKLIKLTIIFNSYYSIFLLGK